MEKKTEWICNKLEQNSTKHAPHLARPKQLFSQLLQSMTEYKVNMYVYLKFQTNQSLFSVNVWESNIRKFWQKQKPEPIYHY